jgi:hypothetical protein
MLRYVAFLGLFLTLAARILSATAINIVISDTAGTIAIAAPGLGNQPTNYRNQSTGANGAGPTTSAGGTATISPTGGVGKNDTFRVGVDGETWSGVGVGNNNPISDQEKNRNGIKNGPIDFDDSYGSTLQAPGGEFYNTFSMVDSGPNAYVISSLQLYSGLDLKFYNSSAFDSSAAIASGFLYRDVTGQLGTLTISASALRAFTTDPVPDNEYALLVATVEESLPNGQLGPPETVAMGIAAPEPNMLPALTIVMGLLAGRGTAIRNCMRRT